MSRLPNRELGRRSAGNSLSSLVICAAEQSGVHPSPADRAEQRKTRRIMNQISISYVASFRTFVLFGRDSETIDVEPWSRIGATVLGDRRQVEGCFFLFFFFFAFG